MISRRFGLFIPLATMLGMTVGCAPTEIGPPDPPITDPEPEDPEAAEAAARLAFEGVVAQYDSAKADGELDADECRRIATAFAQTARAHGKRLPVAAFNAGATWDECGEHAKAREIYEELAKDGNFLALNNLGVIAWTEGNTEEALGFFEKSIDANSALAFAARNNVAAAHRDRFARGADTADFEVAQRQIQNVLAIDTSNKKAYENLARLYYDRGRLQDKSYLVLANLVVDRAILILREDGEKSAALYNLAGLLRMQENNQVKALEAFKKATSVEPKHVDANLNIAFIAVGFRDYAQAEKSLEIALGDARQKDNVEAILAMGVAKRGLGKLDEARTYYRKAVKAAPKDPRPHFNLGILTHEHEMDAALGKGIDDKEQVAILERAKKHYGKFVTLAGAGKKWAKLVDDAKGRMFVVDQSIDVIHQQKIIAEKAKQLEILVQQQEAAEARRLREREREALEAEREAANAESNPAPVR